MFYVDCCACIRMHISLLGLFLHARLPNHHLSADARDVIKLVMGLIATVAALVLGLLISSAHRAFDVQEAEVQQLGIHLFQLDRTLERFGKEASEARHLLHRIVSAEIDFATATDGAGVPTDTPLKAQNEAAELFDSVANLSPKTDAQRFMPESGFAPACRFGRYPSIIE